MAKAYAVLSLLQIQVDSFQHKTTMRPRNHLPQMCECVLHLPQATDAMKQAGIDLRQRAEIMAHTEASDAADDVSGMSPQALQEALHNLRVHQIELELQNDELRRTQAALDTEQARYFDFYDLAPVGYITVNDQAVILQANLTTASLLGTQRSKLIGKALPGFLFAPDADHYYLLCKQILAYGSMQSCELRMRKADGQVIWVNLQAIGARGDAGAAVIRIVLSDITERKQAEAALLANTQLTASILDAMPSQIAVLDYSGQILAVNAGWRKFALDNNSPSDPCSSTNPIGINYLDVCQPLGGSVPPEAMSARDGILSVIQGTAPSFYLEYACHSPAQQRWFAMTVTPLCLENHAVVVSHTDITQRRVLEQSAVDASENRFKLVADNTSDGIVIFGADRRISYVSPSYVKQQGYMDAAELLNLLPDMIYASVHPQDRDILSASIDRAIDAQVSDSMYSYRTLNAMGHYVWCEASAKYQYDACGHFYQACVVIRDIHQRRQAEEFQRIAAAAFETQEAIVITDANTMILQVNQAFTQTTGYSAQETVGLPLQIRRSGQHDEDFSREVWDTVHRTGVWQGEIWDRHKGGSLTPKLLTITAVRGDDAAVSHYVGFYFDLSERKDSEAAMLDMNRILTESRQQLRNLVAMNASRLENEKRHMAREVHDELGQVLTALRMDLSLAMLRHAGQLPELNTELQDMRGQVDRAIQGVRDVATSLRPAVLDMGLVPSLAWLCREFARRGRVTCEFKAPDEALTLEPDREVVIFRIVQESLTNITRYAHASHVTVKLTRRDDELSLEVRDNGVGFDLEDVTRRGSLGLLGIRERAIALGGKVDVGSTLGQGTVIRVTIPLKPELTMDPA